MSEVQSMAEELKNIVDEAVSTKANAADLEGVVKTADLDGLVKSEQLDEVKSESAAALEAAKTEIREELEAKFMTGSLITSKKESKNMFAKTSMDNGGDYGLNLNVIKAVTDTTNVDGSPTGAMSPIYTLEQFNPLRTKATIIPVSSGAIQLPASGALTLTSRTAVGVPTRIAEGSVSSGQVVIETWDGTAEYSLESLDDIAGFDGVIQTQSAQATGVAERTDAIAVLKASADSGTAGTIQTSVGANPTATTIVERFANLAGELSTPYHAGAEFAVSRAAWTLLQQSNNNGLNFDPRTGIATLFGYGISIVDGIDDLSAADNNYAYFGNFGQGLALCTRETMSIRRSEEQKLGSMVYYTRARFKNAVWDGGAIVSAQRS